jgi:hypothetical protein
MSQSKVRNRAKRGGRGQHDLQSYLCFGHVIWITVLLPHERRPHEVLRLNVNEVLSTSDLVNVCRMDTAVNQSTLLRVQVVAAGQSIDGSSLESFRKLGVLFLNVSPINQTLAYEFLSRYFRNVWIELIDP